MPLIETKIERIAPEPQPGDDRAPDALASGVAEPLAAELRGIVGAEGLLGRASDIVRYASDASPYRKLPQAVVRPRDVGQVAALMAYCRERDVPLVFRAGGTSLNGQSQTDGVLADVRHHWGGIEVLDDAAERVRVKPGAILGHVNRVLAPYGRKLGPDPASTDIATVGGVVANNSGGMRCGIVRDSYSTIASIKFALPSGTVIDTADPDAAERFERSEPELAAELEAIRDELRADADLRERVRRKFEIKNTTGYRLCAFLDADEPILIRYVSADDAAAPKPARPGAEIQVDPDADPPDVLSGRMIDLASVALEHMALAIDPYPRAPGAELPPGSEESQEEGRESPFSVLAKLARTN